jgi:hypothetical protein
MIIDAVSELVARSNDHRELRAFHRFHKDNPEVLDFLVEEIRLRLEKGFTAYSNRGLWEYPVEIGDAARTWRDIPDE